jgi:dsRNA-specific ribonuclease
MDILTIKYDLEGCQQICATETSNNALRNTLKKWKMDRFVHLPTQSRNVTRITAASTVEALLGAVWIDSDRDYDSVHRAIHNLDIGTEFKHNASHLADTIEIQFYK